MTVRFTEDMENRMWVVHRCMGDVLDSGVKEFSRGITDLEFPRVGMLTIE